MKTLILFGLAASLAMPVMAADSKAEITAAAKKLAETPNYSWKTTVVVPESSRFRPGPSEGKTQKDGLTHVTMSFGDTTVQAVLKGDKAAVTNRDGKWQSVSDPDAGEGRGRFLASMVRGVKVPAAQAVELAEGAKELKKVDDSYSGELTEAAAKALLSFGRPGAEGPAVNNPKGTVKFWLKDGILSKYEFKVTGTVTFNNNDREVDRVTTVEIKDVGTTKVVIPEEAKKVLEGA